MRLYTYPMIYENEETLEAERRIMASIERRFGISSRKLDRNKTRVDFVLIRNGRGWGWAEVKCRWNPSHRYETFMIDKEKIEAVVERAVATNSKARLIIRFTDALGVIDLLACEYTTTIGGRTDRNDPNDQDVVAMIPMRFFKFYPLEDLADMVRPKRVRR